jgi:hypothetical protein
MTNSSNGETLAWELIRAVGSEYGWPGFEPVASSTRSEPR